MARYFEADKGRFDSMLVRDDGHSKTAVAYTYGDEVRLESAYMAADREAVEEFAEQYDIPVVWERDGKPILQAGFGLLV